jgi:phosphoglycolate phosphatase
LRECCFDANAAVGESSGMILVLFDIDGTLISTDGAGLRAFRRAMKDVFGIEIEPAVISPDGKTDPLILKEFLQHYQAMDLWSQTSERKLFARYLECLEVEMARARVSGRARVLPGVPELLEVLSGESDFAVGLATGNLEAGARIKLKSLGLYRYFGFGGFGSDSENRTELTLFGVRRGMSHVAPAPVRGAFVIGDTPFDVLHGHAAGEAVIAVASGRYGFDELESCNPDLVLEDLTETERIVSFMRGKAADETQSRWGKSPPVGA